MNVTTAVVIVFHVRLDVIHHCFVLLCVIVLCHMSDCLACVLLQLPQSRERNETQKTKQKTGEKKESRVRPAPWTLLS